MSKETSRVDTSHQDKETTKTTTNKESQMATASMTDLPSDSEDGEQDISLVITPIDESLWITVRRRRRRPKSQSGRTKSVRPNFDVGTQQPIPYEDHPDRNGSHHRHSRRQTNGHVNADHIMVGTDIMVILKQTSSSEK